MTGIRCNIGALAALGMLAGCSSGGDDGGTGKISLAIMDAPVYDATQLWVTFTGVSLKPQGSGPAIDIDFAGSSPQVDRAINSAMCFTFAQTVYGVKCMLAPNLPNNEGSFKPIAVRAPEGCIVNPVFPASGGSRMLTGHFLGSMVLQALGEVVRDRVMAAPGSPHWASNPSVLVSRRLIWPQTGGMGLGSRLCASHRGGRSRTQVAQGRCPLGEMFHNFR